jgi:hypothetical protein
MRLKSLPETSLQLPFLHKLSADDGTGSRNLERIALAI